MKKMAPLQLSLSDAARLADVQRPVVSMWRRRPLSGHSFPRPVGMVSGEERFDAQEVADYLDATGRGNNPNLSEDLAAHAKLTQVVDLDEIVTVEGLTALLCLATMTDSSLGDLSSGELHRLAEGVDPEDTFLLREIGALGCELESLAALADDLANASYSPSAAFERLLHRYSPSVYPGHAATTLAPAALTLVAQTAAAVATQAGEELPIFVDVTDSSGDLLLTTAQTYAGESAPSFATLALDSPVGRLARRRLRVHDLHRLDVALDQAGDFVVGRGTSRASVHVLQMPPAGMPGLSDLEVLDAVGNLVVQLSDHSRVVVIGPASALTDRPASTEIDLARDAVIRGDRLRAAIRLPRGLLPRSPRRALAMWVLGPAHAAVPVRDRWTVVADVSDRPLDGTTIDGIVTDVVAAMTPDERSAKAGQVPTVGVTEDAAHVLSRQFRFARRVATSSLLPGRKALVGSAGRSRLSGRPPTQSAEQAAAIDRLVAQLGHSPLDGLPVEARADDAPDAGSRTRQTTVWQAISDGYLRAIPGNRLGAEHLNTTTDGRIVIGPSEVLNEAAIGSRRIDLLTLAAHYPSGRLTEPGDVVVCATPRVGALVDTEGGSVVQAPARVLRITAAGRSRFLPAVMTVDVKGTSGPGSADWRRWHLRVLTSGAVEALAATTAALDRERDELLARIAVVDELAATLIDAVASGAVTITTTPPTSPLTPAAEGP